MNHHQLKYFINSIIALIFFLLPLCATAASSEQDINNMLMRGDSEIEQGDYQKAMKCYFSAWKMAEQQHFDSLQCVAIYNMGVCFYSLYENGEALRHFTDAIKICRGKKLGWQLESQILNGIAGVYYDENNFDKAEAITSHCLKSALNRNDSLDIFTFALNLARTTSQKGQYQKVDKYLAIAQRYLASSDSANFIRMKVVDAISSFRQKKYDRVKMLAPGILSNKHTLNNDKGVILFYLMKIARQESDVSRAFLYARDAERYASVKIKPDLYRNISELYEETGDLQKSISYKDSVIFCNDLLQKMQNRQLTESSKLKIEVMRMQSDMDKKVAELTQHRSIFVLLLCICALLIIIGVIILCTQRQKSRQDKLLMNMKLEKEQQDKLLVENQMKETELVAQYQKKMMEQLLRQKSQELATTTMFVSSRNALIENLLASLSDLKVEKDGAQTLQNIIQNLKQQLKYSNESDSFIVNFESSNPDFVENLKKMHPNTSSSDIRFLAYIRMNLSNKEISSLLNITPESCKRRKIRLSTKLGLDSSKDLYNYIAHI